MAQMAMYEDLWAKEKTIKRLESVSPVCQIHPDATIFHALRFCAWSSVNEHRLKSLKDTMAVPKMLLLTRKAFCTGAGRAQGGLQVYSRGISFTHLIDNYFQVQSSDISHRSLTDQILHPDFVAQYACMSHNSIGHLHCLPGTVGVCTNLAHHVT